MLPFAHALVARQDLPIPAWLFAWGASIVLIVSFFALSAAWREPRFEDERWRPLGAGLSRALLGLPAQVLCGATGVFLLGVPIYSGLRGTEAPDRNFAITFTFVTGWLGFPLFQRRLRRRLQALQPVAGGRPRRRWAAFEVIAGQRFAHLPYPEGLGRWPAAAGLVAFVWLEVVYGVSGGVAVGVSPPHAVGIAALLYSAYTLAMMVVFGVEEWCERGEVFSVYFGMFSRLGFLGVERRAARRAAALLGGERAGRRCPARSCVVLASIGTTSFDGAQEGAFKGGARKHLRMAARPSASAPIAALRLTDTLFIAALLRRRRASSTCSGVRGMRDRRAARRRCASCAPGSPTP